MSNQQLYINDVAVDMPNDDIKIRVSSNILADVSKVMTAHSYSIHLPRTMTNDDVMSLAYVAGANTGGLSTHCYLKASLYMDGVPLFEGGKAVLNSIDDKGYNLNLYWGLVDVFDEIKNEGLQLCDLCMSSHWNDGTMATWTTLGKYYLNDDPPIYDGGMDDDIYDGLNSAGKALADTLPWTMPFVSASTIMSKIASVYGLTFSYSNQFTQRMGALMIPLTTLRTKAKDEVLTFTEGTKYVILSSDYNRKSLSVSIPRDANNGRFLQNAVYTTTESGTGYNKLWAKHKINIKSIKVTNAYCDKPFGVVVRNAPLNDRAVFGVLNTSTGLYEIASFEWRNIVCEADDNILDVANDGSYWTSGETPNFSINFDITIDDIGDSAVHDNWCFERNYPAMKIYDFIGEMLAHCGGCIVGSVTKPTSIRFVTLYEIVEAAPINIDAQGVKSITMSMSDLAQRNNYLHKDNEDNEGDGLEAYKAEGVIYTDDMTLNLERDAYKSSFKVPRTNLVKLWKVEKQDNESTNKASWNNAGEYIMGADANAPQSVVLLVNNGQDFQSIIDQYYTNYATIVHRPKSLEVVVRLQTLDMIAFDFARPIYIPQLGRSYICESLESDNGEQYKLKLIQI